MTLPSDPILRGLMIRPMLEADLPAVLEVERNTPRASHWTLRDYQHCLDASKEGLKRWAWIAESGSGLLGFAVLVGVGDGPAVAFELESLVVHPRVQRCGVGRRLMSTIIGFLKASSAPDLILEVRASNLGAIRLYEGFGFIRTGVRKAYYGRSDGKPSEDAVLMQLKL